jgi:hypothetical protein
MPNSLKRLCTCLLFILVVLGGSHVSANKYDGCKSDIQRIWNENVTLRGFDKDTLGPLFYTGHIERFDGTVPRFMLEGNVTDDIYMPFTYKGRFESRTVVLAHSPWPSLSDLQLYGDIADIQRLQSSV